jgi:MFS family permease
MPRTLSLHTAKSQIILLTIAASLFWLTFSSGVILSLFVLQTLGASPSQLSLTVTLGIVVGFLIDVPSSAAADKYGRRPVIIIALLFGLIGVILSALSPNFVVFLIASSFLSLRNALRHGVIEAMVYDQIHIGGHKEKYHYIMSRYGMLARRATGNRPQCPGRILG